MALVPPLLLALFFSMSGGGNAQPKVPAIYVFGDSLADVGNNNYLGHDSVNFSPYGIDFPGSIPTGRCTNGYNVIDFLAVHMGFPSSPPPFPSDLNSTSLGANFASAGSGILDSTGNYTVINMAQQIKYFENIKPQIPVDVLSKSIFIISSGSNDIGAFVKAGDFSQTEQFYNDLISNYTKHIKALYNLGARKFGIIDIPPVGCVPYVTNCSGNCSKPNCNILGNILARAVNDGYERMLRDLSSTLTGMKYSLANSSQLVSEMIADPKAFGYKDVQNACCKFNRSDGVSCIPNNTNYCGNRTEYLFWDGVHGTQETYRQAGQAIYNGSYASPITFEQLVEDDIDGSQDAREKASLAIYSDPQYASSS